MSVTVTTTAELQAALNGSEDPIIVKGTIVGPFTCKVNHTLKGFDNTSTIINRTGGVPDIPGMVQTPALPTFNITAGATLRLEDINIIISGEGWVSSTGENGKFYMIDGEITSHSSASAFQGTTSPSGFPRGVVILTSVNIIASGPVTTGPNRPVIYIQSGSDVNAPSGAIDFLKDSKILGSAPYQIGESINSEVRLVASFSYPDGAVITGSTITATEIAPLTASDRAAQFSFNQITTTGLCNIQAKTPIIGNNIIAQYVIFTAPSAIGNKITVTAPNTPNSIFNVDQVSNLKLKGPGGVGNVPRSTFNKDDATTTMLQLDNLNLDGDMWVMMDAQQNNVVASHNLTEAGAVSTFKGQLTNIQTAQITSTTNANGAVNVSGSVFPPVTQFTP